MTTVTASFRAMTDAQIFTVRALRDRLSLTEAALDYHCLMRFDQPFHRLDHLQVRGLIDELSDWAGLPQSERKERRR